MIQKNKNPCLSFSHRRIKPPKPKLRPPFFWSSYSLALFFSLDYFFPSLENITHCDYFCDEHKIFLRQRSLFHHFSLSLCHQEMVTAILIKASDWSMLITWPEHWPLIGQDRSQPPSISNSWDDHIPVTLRTPHIFVPWPLTPGIFLQVSLL